MFQRIIAFGYTRQFVTGQSTAGLENLVQSGEPERIATGFKNTEGPVWHPDGYLLFSDINDNTIYKWTPDGKVEMFGSPSGYSNELTFDKQGRLLACEHSNRRVSRTDPDGTIATHPLLTPAPTVHPVINAAYEALAKLRTNKEF